MSSRQHAQAIALAAVAIVATLGVLAFVIDAAFFFEARRELQNSADAAAEAGVIKLPNDVSGAVSVATDYAQANVGIANRLCDHGAPSVSPPQAGSLPLSDGTGSVYTLTVTLSCDVSYSFGRIFGLTSARVAATGTAAIGTLVNEECPIAFGVEAQPGSTGASNNFGWGIGTNVTMAIHATTPDAQNAIALCLDPSNPNCSGNDIGNYIARNPCIAVPVGIANLHSMAGAKAQTVGNMVDGFATRFQTTKQGNRVNCPDGADPRIGNPSAGALPTVSNDGTWTVVRNSNCLAAVPVLDPGSVTNLQGSGSVNVEGFALFYISFYDKIGPEGTVTGYFLKPTITGKLGTYNPNGQPLIRLIR